MQGEKPVYTEGFNNEPIKGESGLTCIADTTIYELNIEEIDSLLLTGCMVIFSFEKELGLINYSSM